MEVWLPGGLPVGERLERCARFQPLTGRLERSLVEIDHRQSRPAYVTAVLSTSLACIGSQPADTASVAALCVADRQFLMLRLGALLAGEQLWLQATCGFCDAMFDINIRRDELPVVEAGENFPTVRVNLDNDEIEIRIPNGADQEAIGACEENEAIRQLLHRCVLSVNDRPPSVDFLQQLSSDTMAIIDAALDKASPAVCGELLVRCPECNREQHAKLDHYAFPRIDDTDLLEEVHTLAMHYHWRESDILDLPTTRRRKYLGLIRHVADAEWTE